MSGYMRRRQGVPPLSRTRSLVVPDDFGGKLEELEKANPFSFKEYLKTKNLSLSNEDMTTRRIYWKEASRHPLRLEHSSPASQPMGYGLEYQQPFFEDRTRASKLKEEEENGWNRTHLPSVVGQTHRAIQNSLSCGTNLSSFSNTSALAGPKSLSPWMRYDTDSRIFPAFPARNPNGDFAAHEESLGDRHLRMLQISYEALQDENFKLRRKLNEVRSFSETQTEMVRMLEQKLEVKMIKEENDYHDLKSTVQQVEQNLELMTQRAVKAENQVLKLKQEIKLLQEQLSNLRQENEALQSGQDASLTVVKQNMDVALQNLHVVMNSAQSSLKQLVSGGETLNLVAELLKSIDRITEVKAEGDS
ncbi:endosome-associated-trafficking regulator 1-like isoform X2 [Mus pahari]|uniref:endosome-associated-trafficking regulator 1-like isoform X2 n=1 Tax=Mus pahari TaxID=10093 RepID=UPI000A30D410|nr:endosome-associated-trafficking regulator 1-like isoform X2 [Mus pahari]